MGLRKTQKTSNERMLACPPAGCALTLSLTMNFSLVPMHAQNLYCYTSKFKIMFKASSFLWLLVLSTVFLAFALRSSNPFAIIKPKAAGLNQGIEKHNGTVDQKEIQSKSFATEEKGCDLSVGKWVREPKGSVYTNLTCSTLPDSKNCAKYGKDEGHLHWKWKPDGCELPRFDPLAFLGIVRGKKLAFVGDSLARNQMESLLCLLSQAESPTDVYKDATDKCRTWYFSSHNFTLTVIWTQFLVEGAERIVNGTVIPNVFDIHLDRVNPAWAEKLPELHYLVISSGNWFSRQNFFYDNGTLIGCTYCNDKRLTQHFSIQHAIRRVFSTALQFINRCEECDDNLVTLLRTFSPPHFEHGSWFTGGYCNRTRPLNEGDVSLDEKAFELRKIQLEEAGRIKEGDVRGKKRFEALDVTKAMMVRADGHPGSHVNWGRKSSVNDCLHWCLPGAIDMWNDLLLATLKMN